MIIRNLTNYDVEDLIQTAVQEFPAHDLRELAVEIKYCPRTSRQFASGTYYRCAKGRPDGRLIRVRINRANVYPVVVHFRTSQYYREKNSRGQEMVYQKLETVSLRSPEHLVLAIFLHEFSHFLDHLAGRNGRYKQTKADKFAFQKLKALGVL
ncbi:MAG: hypothetical protein QHI38_00125 [Armatimonadota bacterium]|nr:hypothetical protein [Armatimonadota bacterium]